jgi:hypothetical protein
MFNVVYFFFLFITTLLTEILSYQRLRDKHNSVSFTKKITKALLLDNTIYFILSLVNLVGFSINLVYVKYNGLSMEIDKLYFLAIIPIVIWLILYNHEYKDYDEDKYYIKNIVSHIAFIILTLVGIIKMLIFIF